MIREFEEQLLRKGYVRTDSRPEWIHIYIKEEADAAAPGGWTVSRVVACVDLKKDTGLVSEQIPIIRSRLGQAYRLTNASMQTLFILFSADVESGRKISTENEYCWFVDEVHNRLILFENQPSDFDGLRQIAEEITAAGTSGTGRRAQERPKQSAVPSRKWKEAVRWALVGQKKHFVTCAIVVINLITYLVLSLGGNLENSDYMIRVGGMFPELVLGSGQWWRLLTCIFLHFTPSHLLNNMIILYFLGKQLEEAAGSLRFALIYFCSGIGGALLSLILMVRNGEMYTVSAGASGAIFGVMGGMFMVILLHKGRYRGMNMQRMLFMLFLCIYEGFTSAGVDNAGHIGGLLTGTAVTFLLYGIPFIYEQHEKQEKR